MQYTLALSKLWNDRSQFTPIAQTPTQFLHNIANLVPMHLLRRYSWGIDLKASLPYGYVLLKRKKRYLSGRSIISYSGTTIGKL
jgi:hypothetical protein